MTVKKKASKPVGVPNYIQMDASEDLINNVINRGGKTTQDKESPKKEEDDIRFTLRIPEALIKKIDKSRRSRVGNVSRNQWIVELINNAVDRGSGQQ